MSVHGTNKLRHHLETRCEFQKDDTTSVPMAARKHMARSKKHHSKHMKKMRSLVRQFIKSRCFHYEGRRNAEIAIADFWRGRAVRGTSAAAPSFVRFEKRRAGIQRN